MKKCLCMMGILIGALVFGTEIYAQTTVNLDNAVNGAVDEFSKNLKKGSKIAILVMRCDSARMSNYLIEELTSVFVNQRDFTVVDRAQLDLIQKEMNFQMSGEVSDSSMQEIGKKLGAQAIVTGTFEPVGNYYRFRVRVIQVETATILFIYSANVQNDYIVASLMGNNAATSTTVPLATGYQNFSSGQRWGTWALNNFILPGLGSYVIMQDYTGGTIQLVLGVSGLGFYLGGLAVLLSSYRTEYVEQTYDYKTGTYSGGYDETIVDEDMMSGGIAMMVISGTLLLSDFIYNIVRSATYDKPQPQVGSLADLNAWSLAILPGENGVELVQVAYTLRF